MKDTSIATEKFIKEINQQKTVAPDWIIGNITDIRWKQDIVNIRERALACREATVVMAVATHSPTRKIVLQAEASRQQIERNTRIITTSAHTSGARIANTFHFIIASNSKVVIENIMLKDEQLQPISGSLQLNSIGHPDDYIQKTSQKDRPKWKIKYTTRKL